MPNRTHAEDASISEYDHKLFVIVHHLSPRLGAPRRPPSLSPTSEMLGDIPLLSDPSSLSLSSLIPSADVSLLSPLSRTDRPVLPEKTGFFFLVLFQYVRCETSHGLCCAPGWGEAIQTRAELADGLTLSQPPPFFISSPSPVELVKLWVKVKDCVSCGFWDVSGPLVRAPRGARALMFLWHIPDHRSVTGQLSRYDNDVNALPVSLFCYKPSAGHRGRTSPRQCYWSCSSWWLNVMSAWWRGGLNPRVSVRTGTSPHKTRSQLGEALCLSTERVRVGVYGRAREAL